MRLPQRLATGAATVAVALVAGSSTVTAVISPGDYRVDEITITVPYAAPAGSYLDCPAGQRPVSGGSYWHRPGEPPTASTFGYIVASAPSQDGKLWAGAGYGLDYSAPKLTIIALCLPTSTIGRTQAVAASIAVDQQQSRGVEVACPAGTKVLSGGAFYGRDDNTIPDMSAPGRINSSTVSSDGTRWYATGRNDTGGHVADRRWLYATAQCVPSSVVGTYTSRVVRRHMSPGTAAGATASCPTGMRVVTGGAVWNINGQPDASLRASLMGSAPSATGTSWSAWGRNSSAATLTMVVTALCVPA